MCLGAQNHAMQAVVDDIDLDELRLMWLVFLVRAR
jgi:hypothetical protein